MLQEIKEFFQLTIVSCINSIIHINRKELSRDSEYKNIFDYVTILSVDYNN